MILTNNCNRLEIAIKLIRLSNQSIHYFQCKDMPEAITLLDIADKNIPGNFDVNELQNQIQHPFVVVEGLDATGKHSTLS